MRVALVNAPLRSAVCDHGVEPRRASVSGLHGTGPCWSLAWDQSTSPGRVHRRGRSVRQPTPGCRRRGRPRRTSPPSSPPWPRIGRELGKEGPGQFAIPGLVKLQVVRNPATKERQGVSPSTGAPDDVQGQAGAAHVVRARPLKATQGIGLTRGDKRPSGNASATRQVSAPPCRERPVEPYAHGRAGSGFRRSPSAAVRSSRTYRSRTLRPIRRL